jgi:hypothetical protein
MTVPKDADRELVETRRQELETTLQELSRAADRGARGDDGPAL